MIDVDVIALALLAYFGIQAAVIRVAVDRDEPMITMVLIPLLIPLVLFACMVASWQK